VRFTGSRLRQLNVSYLSFEDADLAAAVAASPCLEVLAVSGTAAGLHTARALRGAASLRALLVGRCDQFRAACIDLCRSCLALHLVEATVCEAGLAALLSLPFLKCLRVSLDHTALRRREGGLHAGQLHLPTDKAARSLRTLAIEKWTRGRQAVAMLMVTPFPALQRLCFVDGEFGGLGSFRAEVGRWVRTLPSLTALIAPAQSAARLAPACTWECYFNSGAAAGFAAPEAAYFPDPEEPDAPLDPLYRLIAPRPPHAAWRWQRQSGLAAADSVDAADVGQGDAQL
jgi:hypothetical protein